MPFVKDIPPAGSSREELVRFYDREYQKIEDEFLRLDAVLEAINIVGAAANWFWDDTFLGDPGAGNMRANTNTMSAMTIINVSYINAQGKDIRQLLKTSTIEIGDLVGLINTSGLGSGNYDVSAQTLFLANHISVQTANFRGRSGNPAVGDIMQLRWEFSTFPPQRVLP